MISLCLDQSTLIQAERLRTGPGEPLTIHINSTFVKQQQYRCRILCIISSMWLFHHAIKLPQTYLWTCRQIQGLQSVSKFALIKMLRLFFTKKQRKCEQTETALHQFLITDTKHTHARTHTNLSHTVSAYISACGIGLTLYRSLKGKVVLMSKANLFMLIVFMGNRSITLINTVCLIGK